MKNDKKIVRCRRCGRALKNPTSRVLGIGSTCQKKDGVPFIEPKYLFTFLLNSDK